MTASEFRHLRVRLGFTQGRLAERLGVHRITLVRWEQGHTRIPEATAQLLRLMATAKRPPKKP